MMIWHHNFFMNWIGFIEEISAISGTNDKIDYLKKCKKDEAIKKLLIYTYDPTRTYGVRSTTLYYGYGEKVATNRDLDEFCKILDNLSMRDLTGNKARETLEIFISQFAEADEFIKILDGSLDIGIGKTGINKAIPKLISVFKVTLAKKYKWDSKIPFDQCCVSQKFDGVRCIIIRQGKMVQFVSRTGKHFRTLDALKPEILKMPYDNFVLDGEIIRGDGTGKYFQELMKEIRKKDYTMNDFTYQVFDIMSVEDFYGKTKTPYLSRQFYYEYEDSDHIKHVYQTVVYKPEHLDTMWEEAMNKGWEGLMLRNGMSPYEAKRTSNLLKMKAMQDEEFEVMGYQEGSGRLKNSLGSVGVNVGGKTVWVGSGFSDVDRDTIWRTKPIGVKVTIQYFEKTKDGSLRFPVFKSFRD